MTGASAADALYFASPAEFRGWLEANHASARELWVGYHRRGTGRPSLTWPESVDQALCFGWIDGIRKSVDAERYAIRFTPRKKDSIWSAVNLRRMPELIEAGLVAPAGRAAYERRDPRKAGVYSFEQRHELAFTPEQEAAFRAHDAAWRWWTAQPPGYRRTVTFWVVSAKREETRRKRLELLIADCAAGRRIRGMER